MIDQDIKESASNKAFAKLTTLDFEAQDLRKDIRTGNIGPITEEELIKIYQGTKKEIQIWNYIAKLIETDEE
jgi:hypothetical protein